MELIIHSYGYGETIRNSLESLGMIRNSSLYPAMITTISLMVGTFYAWQMAASSAEGEWRRYLRRVLGMLFLINALLLPKSSMYVKDHVEDGPLWKVDNILLAFVLPIGAIEEVGHLMTVGFEQAFNTIGGKSSFDYYNYGTIFGARLSKEIMFAKFKDSELIYSLRNFVDRCIITRAKIGHPFTLSELFESENIWALVSAKPGIVTRFDLISNGKHSIPNCKEGVAHFNALIGTQKTDILSQISKKFRGAGNSALEKESKHLLFSNQIEAQIKALYGPSMEVDQILKHNLLINSINDYRAGNMANVRAQMQYEASGLLSSDQAEWLLTKSLAVFKNIVYGAFVFLVPLILISGGMTKYRNWITMAFSLQLWPALFAMINMMIDYSYDPIKIVSYSAWSSQVKQLDSMASVAGQLSMLIPFLAIWITRMGEGGLMHMAGSIMATANSAIASASIEKATGNISWDNVSTGNVSRNNTSANKYDDNMQYFSGANTIQQADGSILKTNADGSVISQRGAGFDASSGESTYRFSNGLIVNEQEAIRGEKQLVASESASYNTAQENLMSREITALETLSKARKKDGSFSFDTSTESGKEIANMISNVERHAETSQTDFETSAKVVYGSDKSVLGKVTKWLSGLSAEVSASVGYKKSSADSTENIHDHQISERTSQSTKSSTNESYLESLGIDKSAQDLMRKSYNKTKRLEESISKHKDNIEAHTENIDYIKSHSSEFNKDMYQEVVDRYKERSDIKDDFIAGQVVSSGSKEAIGIFREISSEKAKEIFSKIRSEKSKIENSDGVQHFKSENQHNIQIDMSHDSEVAKRNVGVDNAENEIDSAASQLKMNHLNKK